MQPLFIAIRSVLGDLATNSSNLISASFDREKKLQDSVRRTLRFGWSVRNKRGKVLVQRFYPDINKKFSVVLPIAWEPNEELNVLNSLQEINEASKVMQNKY